MDRGPAFGRNGTAYTAELYSGHAVEIIRTHAAPEGPLFLYVGFQ
jgi:hypothetical protein